MRCVVILERGEEGSGTYMPDFLGCVAVGDLNEQMNPAEVLALEIRQYVSQDSNLKTLVPRLIGQTAKAQIIKSSGARNGKRWNEDSFFEALDMNRGPEEVATARKILKWCRLAG